MVGAAPCQGLLGDHADGAVDLLADRFTVSFALKIVLSDADRIEQVYLGH